MIAVLFARRDSIYKTMPECDVWDIDRDARNYAGPDSVVTHAPCRAWGSLRHCAKPRADEKDLAFFALGAVRRFGGVLEHPQRSTFFAAANLPEPGTCDEFGGFTYVVDQFWFGHRAKKATKLYICGINAFDVPGHPIALGEAPRTVGLWSGRDKKNCRPSISKAEFEATPPAFARWLVDLAMRCKAPNAPAQLANSLTD